MPHSLVSVAVCTYNSGAYLMPLLESLVTQTYKHIEIICCDDNSTDDTQTALLKFQQLHPENLKLHFNESNIGHIKNFEQSLSLCRGDYIAIADHDDIWMVDKIEKLMSGIGEAMLIYSDSIYIDENGNNMGRQLTTKFNLHDRPDPRSFAFASSVWGHTVLLNRNLLQTALPFPEKAPYDTWLAYVAASISEVRYFAEPLTYWRQHPSSHSTLYFSDKSKKKNLRYYDWLEIMHWLKMMKNFSGNKHLAFFKKLYALYEKKGNRTFVWPLYFFLVKHRRSLFKVWRRTYFSSLNECRKMATGVKESR